MELYYCHGENKDIVPHQDQSLYLCIPISHSSIRTSLHGQAICLEPGCSIPFCFFKRPCNSLIIRYYCVTSIIFWELECRFLAHIRVLWLTFWEGIERPLFHKGDFSCEWPCWSLSVIFSFVDVEFIDSCFKNAWGHICRRIILTILEAVVRSWLSSEIIWFAPSRSNTVYKNFSRRAKILENKDYTSYCRINLLKR